MNANNASIAETVSFDYETFSECDLKTAGAWRYAMDPSTEVLCAAYSINGADPVIWTPGMAPPQALFDALARGAKFYAWNAAFEIAVWLNVCQRRYGWPALQIEQVIDSMAVAASFAFPMKLEDAAIALGAPHKKDPRGKKLLDRFAKRRKPTKKIPATRIYPADDPEGFAELCRYCQQDVRTEQSILSMLPRQRLSDFEQRIWLTDLKNNMRGVRVDVPMVEHIISLAAEHAEKLDAECEAIAGATSGKRDAIMAFCSREGYQLEGYTADDVDKALADDELPCRVRRVLEIRKSLGKTSVKKYPAMRACVGFDGRMRGMTVYHGATTGRFAGRLVQLQNLPRGAIKKVDRWAQYTAKLGLEDFITLCDDPMEGFSSLVRSTILPSEGHQLYVADFANIEGRVLAWMSGQEDLVAQFAANDDVYKHMAAVIFNTTYDKVTDDQRQVGKQAVLGCGYGMGWRKFQQTCLEKAGIVISDELAQATVDAYRAKNARIKAMWYDTEKAAIRAVQNPGMRFTAAKVTWGMQGDFLYAKPPSGRCLAYYKPKIKQKTLPWGKETLELSFMGKDAFTGQWTRLGTYGGHLVENVVQAAARDLLVTGMLATEEAGYVPLTTVHDELISEAPLGHGSVKEFEQLMAVIPPWAQGCPVKSEGWSGLRYRK